MELISGNRVQLKFIAFCMRTYDRQSFFCHLYFLPDTEKYWKVKVSLQLCIGLYGFDFLWWYNCVDGVTVRIWGLQFEWHICNEIYFQWDYINSIYQNGWFRSDIPLESVLLRICLWQCTFRLRSISVHVVHRSIPTDLYC